MSCRSTPASVAVVEALRQVDGWPCEHVAVAVTGAVEATHGDASRRFPWASVTKLATAVAVLVAAEEGIVDLDEPAGPPGSTVRHLLAHASGLPFEAGAPIARAGHAAHLLELRLRGRRRARRGAGRDAVRRRTSRTCGGDRRCAAGSAGSGRRGTLADLLALARELLEPTRDRAARRSTRRRTVQFPGLDGVLPGFGRQEPNDWGLGFELRDAQVAALDGRAQLAARRSATSAAAARSSGSTPTPASRSRASPTSPSATGRRGVAAPGRRGPRRSRPVARTARQRPGPTQLQLNVLRTGTRAGARSAPRAGRPRRGGRRRGRRRARASWISSARCCGDRLEVRLVVVADDHERRHRERRERRAARARSAPAPRARTAARAPAAAAGAPRRGARA